MWHYALTENTYGLRYVQENIVKRIFYYLLVSLFGLLTVFASSEIVLRAVRPTPPPHPDDLFYLPDFQAEYTQVGGVLSPDFNYLAPNDIQGKYIHITNGIRATTGQPKFYSGF